MRVTSVLVVDAEPVVAAAIGAEISLDVNEVAVVEAIGPASLHVNAIALPVKDLHEP